MSAVQSGLENVFFDHRPDKENVLISWHGFESNLTNFILTIAENEGICLERKVVGNEILLRPSDGVMIGRTYYLTLKGNAGATGVYEILHRKKILLGGLMVPRDVSAVVHESHPSRWVEVSFKRPVRWDEDMEYIIRTIPKRSHTKLYTDKNRATLKYLKSNKEYIVQVRVNTDCMETIWSTAIVKTAPPGNQGVSSYLSFNQTKNMSVTMGSLTVNPPPNYQLSVPENFGSVRNLHASLNHEDKFKIYYKVYWDAPNFNGRPSDYLIDYFELHILMLNGKKVADRQVRFKIDRTSYYSEEFGLDFDSQYKILVKTKYENVDEEIGIISQETKEDLRTLVKKRWTDEDLDDDAMFGIPVNCIAKYSSDTSYVFQQISTGKIRHEDLVFARKRIDDAMQLNHPNLLKYYTFHEEKSMITLTMESFAWCTLKAVVKREKGLAEGEAATYTEQILDGLSFLHELNLCDVNITCSAICWNAKTGIKLYDYAFPRSLSNQLSLQFTSASGRRDLWDPDPEEVGKPADIWRVGCTIYEMLTTLPPWAKVEQKERAKLVHRRQSPNFPSDKFSGTLKTFLQSIFVSETIRSNIPTLRDHDWIRRKDAERGMDTQNEALVDDTSRGQTDVERQEPSQATASGPVVDVLSDGPSDEEIRLEEECLKGQWNDPTYISQGGFSLVYSVANTAAPGGKLAIKVIDEKGMNGTHLAREIALARKLRHRRIVKCYGSVRREFRGKHPLCLVMEHMECTLTDEILKVGGLPESRAKQLTSDILEAIIFLHNRGLVHRDLKTENILLDDRGGAKIGDFGLAKELRGGLPNTATQGVIGTYRCMSPEAVKSAVDKKQKVKIGKKTDIWSLGCIVYEMIAECSPHSSNEMTIPTRLLLKLITEEMPKPPNISKCLQEFLDLTFIKDPEHRPHAIDLYHHNWLRIDATVAV